MKTKLLITFLFLALIAEKTSSQTYIPMLNNSSWNIVSSDWGGSQNLVINPATDVIINSITYKKFIDPTSNTAVYLREDATAKKVYRRVNGIDQILYDFSLQVSNTIVLSDGYTYTVQSITNQNVVGGTRRRFNLIHYIGTFVASAEVWIEGVGSPDHPLKPFSELPSDPAISLSCSAQNGINIYNSGIANEQPTPTDCSMLLSVEDITYLKQEINFAPVPFKNELVITRRTDFINATFKIFNSIGQLVKEQNNLNGPNIIINRGNLNSGIYFTQLIENGKVISTNKIIIAD